MYTYMTPSDSGRGDEGYDDEENGLSELFDDPSDDETTFDVEPGRPFAFDGAGQLVAEEQLEGVGQLTAREASALVEQSGFGGLGLTASTLTDSETLLPEAPAGEKWKLVGPIPEGEGYNWETVPVEAPTTTKVKDGLIELVKRNKVAAGVVSLATLGALWWLFLRKRPGQE